jgi:hypothetical protein
MIREPNIVPLILGTYSLEYHYPPENSLNIVTSAQNWRRRG